MSPSAVASFSYSLSWPFAIRVGKPCWTIVMLFYRSGRSFGRSGSDELSVCPRRNFDTSAFVRPHNKPSFSGNWERIRSEADRGSSTRTARGAATSSHQRADGHLLAIAYQLVWMDVAEPTAIASTKSSNTSTVLATQRSHRKLLTQHADFVVTPYRSGTRRS